MASKTPGKKLQTSKRMESLFQLLRKKEETLPPDNVKVLSWRQRTKKLTWAGENGTGTIMVFIPLLIPLEILATGRSDHMKINDKKSFFYGTMMIIVT